MSDLLTMAEAAERVKPGKHVHASTIWRWCRVGLKGVRLRYLRAGRTILIDPADIDQFRRELAAVDDAEVLRSAAPRPAPPRRRGDRRREERIQQADRKVRRRLAKAEA